MACILCIETATTNCSVALSVNGSVIAFREDSSKGYSHAEKLHVFIAEVLQEAAIEKSEIQAIAVSKGPGSYTGLRIGVSAAKGLCYALDIPLISVETLRVLVQQVSGKGTIVPMLDARRMEVYVAVFNENREEMRGTKAEILTPTSFLNFLDEGQTIFIGDGVSKFEAICDHANAKFVRDTLPSAKDMAILAVEKYHAKHFEDVAYFEPYYLKDFIVGGK